MENRDANGAIESDELDLLISLQDGELVFRERSSGETLLTHGEAADSRAEAAEAEAVAAEAAAEAALAEAAVTAAEAEVEKARADAAEAEVLRLREQLRKTNGEAD